MKKGIFIILFIACAQMLSGQGSGTGGSGINIEFLEETIIGNVVYQDGITPVADLPVRVWSKDQKKMVFRTRTDKDGVFKLPRQQSGESFIFVGQVKIDMKTLTQGGDMLVQNHDLIVVLSRPFTIDMTPKFTDITVGSIAMTVPARIPDNQSEVIPVPEVIRPQPDILIVTNVIVEPPPITVVSP
jgi:hypothetical protein